jgi:subfamily B ATP-binding cassette protein MsbA
MLKNYIRSSDTLSIIARVAKENAKGHVTGYVLAGICLIIIAAATAFTAWIMRILVDDVFVDHNLQTAYIISGSVFVVFLIKGAASYIQDVQLNKIANNIVASYQTKIFRHLLKLGLGYYHNTRSAYLVGQINQNIAGVRNLLNMLVTVVLRDLLSVIALLAVMIYRDPLLSLLSLMIAPPVIILVARYKRRVKRIARQGVDINSRVASSMQEATQGIQIVKAFTMEEQLGRKVEDLAIAAEERANKMARITARTSPLMETLGGIAVAGVVAYSSYNVIILGGSPGDMMSFLTAMLLAYEPAKRLARLNVNLERSLVDARMIYEVLDTPLHQSDKPDAKPFVLGKGEISLEGVDFSYGSADSDTSTVIENMSFVANAGETTALVGPSGGGKSTIISLLQRFHDLDAGTIKIDGQDIKGIKIATLRRHIAYVSQQPFLFEGTIADNLRYARPNASMDELIEAAKLAQAHEFILASPQGYESPVGENGVTLSGGQRQRLSIARAILRDAPILLLDEATSALDNESEALVQSALETVMKDRTTIVIAHRLSTIANADTILVIEKGKVVDSGTHTELAARKSGIYARYNFLQAAGLSYLEHEDNGSEDSSKAQSTTTSQHFEKT